MKKAAEIILKILKVYIIFDVICLAVIGIGEICNENEKEPHKSWYENDVSVIEQSIGKIRRVFVGD